jgi:hypothetical protein
MIKEYHKSCCLCGRPLIIVINGDYISGGHYAGGENNQNGGVIEKWMCKECTFGGDYEDT